MTRDTCQDCHKHIWLATLAKDCHKHLWLATLAIEYIKNCQAVIALRFELISLLKCSSAYGIQETRLSITLPIYHHLVLNALKYEVHDIYFAWNLKNLYFYKQIQDYAFKNSSCSYCNLNLIFKQLVLKNLGIFKFKCEVMCCPLWSKSEKDLYINFPLI